MLGLTQCKEQMEMFEFFSAQKVLLSGVDRNAPIDIEKNGVLKSSQ